ncbi:tyrosine/phenylalanine carboxypeptidase domain-containing protein [Kytococcus sp. Marseille-QA3725]
MTAGPAPPNRDTAGVLVEGDTLLISDRASVPTNRVDALLHHEVGTHLVTQVNGSGQPLKTLGSGLAGYDETQEGLAVLGEIAVGGLPPFRLRQLAVRALTVDRMLEGATFREAFDALVEAGVPARSSYTTTMRVFRSGGLTKDAVYLRGLLHPARITSNWLLDASATKRLQAAVETADLTTLTQKTA